MAKILLVDDAEDILFVLEQSFHKAGHTVLSTSDPRRVMPLSRNGRFDAIVLDVMMPRVTGWSLLSEIRQQAETRSTPVVMLTALTSVADRVRGLRGGADDYMTKPFEPAELIARVERLIDRRATSKAALQGQLDAHSVEDVLQQLEQSRKTGRLEIHSETDAGAITLKEGTIVGAAHGGLEGEEAVLNLLALASGGFYFHAGGRSGLTATPLSLKVGPLLIRSAWIDDELARREHHLPSPSAALSLAGPPRPAPEGLPTLPLHELYVALGRTGRVTLEELLRGSRSASRRVLLAVAWLAECGLLRQQISSVESGTPDAADPGSHDVDNAQLENLDVAVREFLQSGLHRGLRLDAMHLEVYLAPRAWDPGLELLGTIPTPLLEMPEVPTREPFECPLRHPAGSVSMRWTPLTSASDGVPDPPADCAGIVLWLDRDWPTGDLAALGARLAARAPRASCVLLSPNSFRDLNCVGLSTDPQWRTPASPPVTFEQLLLELVQADPNAESAG